METSRPLTTSESLSYVATEAHAYAKEGIPARELFDSKLTTILVDYLVRAGRDGDGKLALAKFACTLTVLARGGTTSKSLPVADILIAGAIGRGLRAGAAAIDSGEEPFSEARDYMAGMLSQALYADPSRERDVAAAKAIVIDYAGVANDAYHSVRKGVASCPSTQPSLA